MYPIDRLTEGTGHLQTVYWEKQETQEGSWSCGRAWQRLHAVFDPQQDMSCDLGEKILFKKKFVGNWNCSMSKHEQELGKLRMINHLEPWDDVAEQWVVCM